MLAHGGALAMLIGRMDLAQIVPRYERHPQCYQHITRPPGTYLRNIYLSSVDEGAALLKRVQHPDPA